MSASETQSIELERETLATLARAAQAGGRFGEMYGFATRLVTAAHARLTNQERDLLTAALVSAVESGQRTWRALVADGALLDPEMEEYAQALATELEGRARSWQELVDELLATRPPAENEVLFHRLTGDQYSALARLAPERRDVFGSAAAASFERGFQVAVEQLAPTHPIRLGLILNYVTCEYEILEDHKKAVVVAKRAFDDAISKLDQLDEASYKDSALIMQQLRDHLAAWTAAHPDAATE